MSISRRNPPPNMNPTTAGSQMGSGPPAERSIAGISRDHTLAAIITPAEKPSMPSSTLGLISRNRKTSAAPRAVTNQVKMVASKAC